MISISSIRATTTFINNCIFIIKRAGASIQQTAADRKPPRLQFGRQGKRAMTYLPTERRRRCRMPPPTPVASYTRRQRRAAEGFGR